VILHVGGQEKYHPAVETSHWTQHCRLDNRRRNGLTGEQRAATWGDSQGKAIEIGSPSLSWKPETSGDTVRSVLLVPLDRRKVELKLHFTRVVECVDKLTVDK
jgi:hypothetical protein